LISAQFQGALVHVRFPWLRLLSNRSGIVARWIRSGWRMPGSLLDLWFALDMQAWLWQGGSSGGDLRETERETEASSGKSSVM